MIKTSKNQTPMDGFEANYQAFMRCGTQASLFADQNFLREMGMYEEVESLLEVSGWKSLLDISCPTYVEDTCEFLASVERKGNFLRYRHRGEYYSANNKAIKRALGYTTRSRDETDQHTDDEAWKALTWSDKKFRAGRSLGSEIREPKFFYLQRLISNTILARFNGSQRLGVLDMAIMKGLVYGKKVKFGEIITEHWTRIKPTSKITAGGMITCFLLRMHWKDVLPGFTVLQPELLNKDKMLRMRAIRLEEDGEAEWCYEGFAVQPTGEGIPMNEEEEPAEEEAQVETPVASTRRARAPVRKQEPTRSSARVRNQAQNRAQPQSSVQAEYPWMDPRHKGDGCSTLRGLWNMQPRTLQS